MHCLQQQILIFNCALNCWSRKTNYSQCSLFPHFWHWAFSPVCLHNSVRSLTSCEATDFGGEVIINWLQSQNDLWSSLWVNNTHEQMAEYERRCRLPAALASLCYACITEQEELLVSRCQHWCHSTGAAQCCRGITEYRWWQNGKILTYANAKLIEKINLRLGYYCNPHLLIIH